VKKTLGFLAIAAFAVTAQTALGDPFILELPSGLSAEVEFTLINPTTLQVRAKNTSTGVPVGFDSADQILTGISWDFGLPGDNPGDISITGGTVFSGPSSASVNFDITNVGANADVSGEWGYSNSNSTGLFQNFVTATQSQSIAFGGTNLDGPVNIDGPQGGMVADPELVLLGGLGAIQEEIIATLTLSGAISESEILGDLGLLRVEFGSNAAFITVPAPGAALLGVFGLGLVVWGTRRSV
jgi:hypothetical protein